MNPLGWLFAGYVVHDILSKDCKQEEKEQKEKHQMTHQEMFPNSSPLNLIRKDKEKD